MSNKSHDELVQEALAETSKAGDYHSSELDSRKRATIADRDTSYTKRRLNVELSPARADPFSDSAPSKNELSYTDILEKKKVDRDQTELARLIKKRDEEEALRASSSSSTYVPPSRPTKRSRWDDEGVPQQSNATAATNTWDATPVAVNSSYTETPVGKSWSDINATPMSSSGMPQTVFRPYNPYDQTPSNSLATPFVSQTMPGTVSRLSAEQAALARAQNDILLRNAPWTDEALDLALPSHGYSILVPPENYVPLRTARSGQTPHEGVFSMNTPAGGFGMPGTYHMPLHDQFIGGQARKEAVDLAPELPPELADINISKESDIVAFAKLFETVDEETLSPEELTERTVMTLILKIKNGAPPQRKSAFKTLTAKARTFGAGPIFSVVLPLFLSVELEDHERHLLVKIISRVLYVLDDLVRPYAHKILMIIQPMLLDREAYTRMEARELVSSLAKAAGLASMIGVIRPDIDSPDEYTRNGVSSSLAVVACALGVQNLVRFLEAITRSQKSWEARHTGMKVVHHIAVLQGCSILPHLPSLVQIVLPGLKDKVSKVRCVTALALASLAEASYPYGHITFSPTYQPLWEGLVSNTGKTLGAYFKAIGFLVPLMPEEIAVTAAHQALVYIVKEFTTPDEDMRRIVLKATQQLITVPSLSSSVVVDHILQPFLEVFWTVRVALDKDNAKRVVSATVDIAEKVGGAVMLQYILPFLKHENEIFRRMAVDGAQAIVIRLGVDDVDRRLEEQLVDAFLFAFQSDSVEQQGTKSVLKGFAVLLNALGERSNAYFAQIAALIKYRLKNRSELIRQQSVELLARIAQVMKDCGQVELLQSLGMLLYENLGEEFPDALAAIIGALKTILVALGPEDMTPPVPELLPRLAPILKNQMEKVQENIIELIGRIAEDSGESASLKEWMRISFDLLALLKAPKKSIRRAAINTFGYIANAIGPQEVLVTLLNNLKVQDRTNRVSTSIAIAVIAETCRPFMVIPALLNEYRTPDNNVQNGVLKALSFLFEYVGEMGKDYVYAVVPLLTDALSDRDIVHRQTACTVVKHMALGCYGLGREDAMIHLLNYVWPNMFETSAHVLTAVNEAIEALRLSLGPARMMQYILAGLFHPARRVRAVYWRYYNAMYVASQSAVVAAYPRIPDEDKNTYIRWELETFL